MVVIMHKVKCTKEAKKLLDESIQCWIDAHVKLVCDGKRPSHGVLQCPLCEEFYWEEDCAGCPLSGGYRKGECKATPYPNWYYNPVSAPQHLAMITYMKDLYKRCVVE